MARKASQTRVLLVDDHRLLRQGIRRLLERYEDVRIIGEANNGVEAVQYARSLNPHVIVMDISMPYMDGVQATRLIKQERPFITIIGLSMIDGPAMRDALLQAGAATYVNKGRVVEELYAAISRQMATGLSQTNLPAGGWGGPPYFERRKSDPW
jgi:DNA-binding NarL/FixJ family response regulator